MSPIAMSAQVVFSQDFSGGGTPSSYVGTPAGANQFDGILPTPTDGGFNWAIANGELEGTRTSTSGAATRITDLPGLAGSAASFQFDFNLLTTGTETNNTNDVVFQVGKGYTNSTGAGSGTFAQFPIDLQTGGIYVVGGHSFSGPQTVYFALNNSGSAKTFQTPGGPLSVDNGSATLYVGTTLIASNLGVVNFGGSGTQDITDFKLRFGVDTGTVGVDNFVITQVPEPSTLAALFAGAPLAWAAVRRRRREELGPLAPAVARGC